MKTIAEVLAGARLGLRRMSPTEAASAYDHGALLVDIRPHSQRVEEGEVPGAWVIERNVLEWRLDPSSGASIPEASHDGVVVVICSEGYTSSLAAAALQELGITRATDLDGGFIAWRDAGLPTVPGGTVSGQRTPSSR